MDSGYYDIYEQLYVDYIYDNERTYTRRYRERYFDREFERPFYEELQLLRITRNTIDNTQQYQKASLRPDARYFLLTSFHSMIIKPVIERLLQGSDISYGFRELQNDIVEDINTIVDHSRSRKEEISGHVIMESINSKWRELRTTRMEIWG